MELHQLRYFVSVAQHHNFSRAAEACFVSQPSLSQQIKKLETELGEPLIQRCREGALLTPFGESLLPRAKRILSDASHLLEEADARHTKIQGQIRLGAIPTIAPYILPNLIRPFVEAHPATEFVIEEETTDLLIRHLHAGRLDFAVLSPPFPGPKEFRSTALREDELLLTLPPLHPLAQRKRVRLSQLADSPIVLLKDAHCLSRQIVSLCESSGVPPKVTIESSQLDTVLAMVELNLGFSFTPAMALPSLGHRKVVYRSLYPRPVSRSIVLIHLKQQPLSRAQQAFLDLARAC